MLVPGVGRTNSHSKSYIEIRENLMRNAAPLMIQGMTQHGMASLSSVDHSRQVRHYDLFETTPLSWGSKVVGYRPHPKLAAESVDAVSLGTCMELSGAAVSGTLGVFAEKSWTTKVIETVVAWMGLETGRHMAWSSENPNNDGAAEGEDIGRISIMGRKLSKQAPGYVLHLTFMMLCTMQLFFIWNDCDEIAAAEFSGNRQIRAGGFTCVHAGSRVTIIAYIIIALWNMVLAGAIYAPLKYTGHHLYSWLTWWPPMTLLLRGMQHLITLDHNLPQQIFVADGGEHTLQARFT